MTNDNEELKVIYSALDDCRRLIAAGKVQRWDVVKWGVTVNVALATATAAIPFEGAFDLFGLAVPFSFIPFGLAVVVAFVSWLLVSHYNRRTTGARSIRIRRFGGLSRPRHRDGSQASPRAARRVTWEP